MSKFVKGADLPGGGFAVLVTRHPKTKCWLVEKDDNTWMHFADADVSEHTAHAIVSANTGAIKVQTVPYLPKVPR